MDRLFANGLPSCARDHRSKDLSPRSVAGLGLAVMIDSNPEESHVTTPLRWPKMQRLLLAAGQAALLPLAVFFLASVARAAPPDEGECPTLSGSDSEISPDATPLILKPGMRIDHQGVLALQSLMPPEVWRHRDVFFFEGMLMEIGPCHRRYPVPDFYQKATDALSGQVSLDKKGNLENYSAGVPFPPARIDPEASDAATKWAWNLEKRFRGAGPRGRFRINHYPSRMGATLRFEGEFFLYQVAGRSDLKESDYRVPGHDKMMWAGGGLFTSPFDARELAWRQFRSPKSEQKWQAPDDIFVYLPGLRKVRRAGTPWVQGAYVPRFTVAGQSQGSGGIAIGGGNSGINPGAGPSLAVSENAREGLTGLLLRPNAFQWRILGEKTVIAPLNTRNPGWPIVKNRNYGYSGLSVAADRWDVRHAVVIEGALRERSETIRRLIIYIDYQTLQPLYWITRGDRGRIIEVGILVHRFTGDAENYPVWPNSDASLIFEPVAASFFNALAGRGGWMRESYDLISTPVPSSKADRMTTTGALERRH